MEQGQELSVEWDWDALELRGRTAGRIGRYARIATGISFVALVVGLTIDSDDAAWLGFCGLLLVSVAIMMLAELACTHPFLLDPPSYLAWLRKLGPYEPETVWEQAGHQLASWIGGTSLLVLGAVIGALFGTDPSAAGMIATQYIGYLLLAGIPFLWWSGFLVRLASLHRRAISRKELPAHPEGDRISLFLLFFAIWLAGVAVVLGIVLGGPEALKALNGMRSE